jgi:NADP-dependent 3-hydroxy acid dehydrogenase YdfG
MKAFDKVDIIVNDAGTSRAMPFEKVTDEILYDATSN